MSGGDQMLIQLFKRVRKEFEKFWCVTNTFGVTVLEESIANAQFIVSPSFFDRFGLFISYILRTILALRCTRLRPDIVYSSSDFFPDVIPAFILKMLRPKTQWVQCVFHIYPDWRSRPGSKVRAFIGKYLQQFSLRLVKKADLIININSQVKCYLIDKGFDDCKITICPPGADIDYLTSITPASPYEGYDGIYLGRLSPSKGIFDLIEIWGLVVIKCPDAKLGIIGGGDRSIVENLEKLIIEKGLKRNITLLGYKDNDLAFSILKASKIFLFPSHEEGFGIVIVESLACRVPVVAWNLEVFEEYFQDLIYMIQRFSYEQYANKCINILENDIAQITKQLNYGEQCAQKFGWTAVSKNFINLLTKL